MTQFRIHWTAKLLLALVFTLIGLGLTYTGVLARWDRLFYDSLTRALTRSPADDIVILSIDEASLSKDGRWPWPRRIHAQIIDKLTAGGAKVIGFDILFSEADLLNPENDRALTRAISRSKRVILPIISERANGDGTLQVALPLAEMADSAASLAHADVELDSDGIMRRAYLKAGLGRPDWPALGLAMLKLSDPDFDDNLAGIRNPKLNTASRDNWVRDYEILVPFTGPPGHFPRISCADFLEPDFDLNRIRDKYILVGTTVAGMDSCFSTPVTGEVTPMPGVEIHANLLDTLKQGVAIEPVTIQFQFFLTAFFILLPFYYYPRLKPSKAIPVTLLLLLSVVATSFLLLTQARLWYGPAPALLLICILYLLWTWRRLEYMVKQLYKEKKYAEVTLNSIGDGVITIDNTGRIQYMNPVAESLTGYRSIEAKNRTLGKVLPIMFEHMDRDLADIVDWCLREKQITQLSETGVMVDRMGDEHTVRLTAGPIHDEAGRAQGVVLGIGDITETKHALQQIAYQATHDTLTGLPNRSMLIDRLRHAITQARRSGRYIALLFIDLDFFKKVNDRLGHHGGNRLLETVGSRLLSSCRDGDTVARIGGNEFVVLLENLKHSKMAASVASKVLKLIELPYHVDGQEVFVTGSIGISLFPKDGDDAQTLLKSGETAMQRSKETGRNTFRFFSLQMHTRIHERLDLEKRLRLALKNNELQLYYQPQIRLKDGKITGVEALIRWKTKDSGFIPPEKFISVAEECGLIVPIGKQVLETALNQAQKWQDEGIDPLRMAVNISPRQFSHKDIPAQLNRIADQTRKKNIRIELEITENMIMEDINRATAILRNFREHGGKVAIDDFGTGYSSLAYLKQFPVDKLKIDSSFIRDIANSKKDISLCGAIISMAHGLGLTVVAEGVESRAQVTILKKLHCDEIQGYLFSHPLPANEITSLVKKTPVVRIL